MVINMHLSMNHCSQEPELEPDLIHQGASSVENSAASAGDQQSPGAIGSAAGCMRAADQQRPVKVIPCPRCQSMNTKFCYYNNYSVNQPRHFCRNCQRYWTVGGTLRNVPVGGGSRKKVRTRGGGGGQRNNNHDAAVAAGDHYHHHHHHHDEPRGAGAGGGFLQGSSHGQLLNMTLQPNVLLPSSMEMAATQQQLSILSQVTGGRLGSSYGNQLLQSAAAAGLMELPPSSNSSQLSTFLQFPNLDQRGGGQINGSYNNNNAIANNFSKTSATAPSAAATGQQQQQDHHHYHHLSTQQLQSAMYDLQQSSHAAVPNSSLQMGSHGIQGGFSSGGLNNNNNNNPAQNHLEAAAAAAHGNHVEFLSSLMHKPGYWGA